MNDENENQDINVGSDGSINESGGEGIKIDVNTEADSSVEPQPSEPAESTTSEAVEPKVDETAPPTTDLPEDSSEPINESVGEVKAAPDSTADTSESPDSGENVISQPESNVVDICRAPAGALQISSPEEPTETSTITSEMTMGEKSSESMGDVSGGVEPAPKTATEVADEALASVKSKKPEHRNNKKFAVFVTVLVAVLLAGAAVFVYISAQNNTEESDTDNQTEQLPPAEETPAPVEETTPPESVDEASQAIDEAVESLDDTSGLSEDAISDDSLGL